MLDLTLLNCVFKPHIAKLKEDREGGGEEVNACGNVLDETGYSEPGGSPPPGRTHVLLQHSAATCSNYTIQRERTDCRWWGFFYG